MSPSSADFWSYETTAGTFWIKQDRSGRFTLGINDEPLGLYINPSMAADDMSAGATGYKEWDSLFTLDDPPNLDPDFAQDLSGWTFHSKP